jgi:hypothetical protein
LSKEKHKETGWARHSIFGLRQEWLDLYLADKKGWSQMGLLGNRQVESLAVWLKTAGLVDKSGQTTWLDSLFTVHGTDNIKLWQLLWVNVVFNFPTAAWYVRLGLGEWNTYQLRSLLLNNVPNFSERTVSNAVLELVGLLERTPVGRELGQGEVSGGRPRRVARRGAVPTDAAIMMAIGRLYLKEQRRHLEWEEEIVWPWIVFGCSRQDILPRLLEVHQNCIEINEAGLTILNTDREWWECGSILTTLR